MSCDPHLLDVFGGISFPIGICGRKKASIERHAGILLWDINYHAEAQVHSRPTESVRFRAGACGVPAGMYSVYLPPGDARLPPEDGGLG
jgi:hypothetical protein